MLEILGGQKDKELLPISEYQPPVRDHCHYTGRYLGAAHNECNLLRRTQTQIPVYFHNFTGYDSHFIIQALQKCDTSFIRKLDGLASNSERFRTLTINNLLFCDSMSFMNSSIDRLVETLKASQHTFPLVKDFYKQWGSDKIELLLRKGVFPYDLLTSLTQFEALTEFPPRSDFYSKLKEDTISQADWEHGKQVFEAFDCRTMVDYLMLYNTLDVVLLAECLTNFRQVCFEAFKLDICQYISLPSYAFDVMLRSTGAKVDFLPSTDMFLHLEKSVRGGVSYASTRYAERKEGEQVLLYGDATNLYGKAQTSYLPYSDYKYLSAEEIEGKDWHNFILEQEDEQEVGFILEVDLEIPKELHAKLDAFPPAPERRKITESDLSEPAKHCYVACKDKLKAKMSDEEVLPTFTYKAEKLVGSLENKTKYTTHYRALKTYIKLGCQLTKVHSVIQFTQADFVKCYVERLAKLRAEATDEFKKQTFKLMSNSCFGKFLEDPRKYSKVTLCRTAKQLQANLVKPTYKNHKILGEKLVAVFSHPENLYINKLPLVGFTILEESKNHMFKLFYDHIQPAFGVDNVEIGFSDTDSFLLIIRNNGNETDAFKKISHIMDFSNYPSEHELYSEKHKGVLGFLKDEMKGKTRIDAVACVRSKTYSMKHSKFDGTPTEHKNVCKGVPKLARSKIGFEEYERAVLDKFVKSGDFTALRSKNHCNRLIQVRKNFFSSFDDKRYMLECQLHSKPYGSQYIEQHGSKCVVCFPTK